MSDILVGLSEKEKGEIIRFGIERGKILLVSSIGIFLLGGIFNVLGESLVFFSLSIPCGYMQEGIMQNHKKGVLCFH